MTEAEWLACDEPEKMLRGLFARGQPPGRRLRLFLCACYRHVPVLVGNEAGLGTVEVIERFADGLATNVELSQAIGRACRLAGNRIVARMTPSHASDVRIRITAEAVDGVAERRYQAGVLQCIFRGEFRRTAFDPAWRTDTAVSLARGMYESRDFSPMPILADALQDAGCEDEQVLTHCRDPQQVHVRGCWVVDLVLGKA